jgi:hypothetical protein
VEKFVPLLLLATGEVADRDHASEEEGLLLQVPLLLPTGGMAGHYYWFWIVTGDTVHILLCGLQKKSLTGNVVTGRQLFLCHLAEFYLLLVWRS